VSPESSNRFQIDGPIGPGYSQVRQIMCRSRFFFMLTGLLYCIGMMGCSAVTQPLRKASHLSGQIILDASIAPDANQNMPVAVDIVTIDDKKTLAEVSAFTAQTWFDKRTAYLRMHPTALHVSSWEWIPGQQLASIKIPQTAVADGILLFANYSTAGDHNAVLPRSGTVRIEFGPKDFKILSSTN
jgi:type VI secretion system protein